MKTLNEFVEDSSINEALLNADQLQFIPCQATKGDVKYCVAVGNVFNIKKTKYAQNVEEHLKELGLNIKTGIAGAQKVVKQASTKLIYVIINSNIVSIYTADILKPLNGEKLQ